MVYFKDKSSPSGENHLIILGNQNQPLEKGTMLAVYAPLIGGRNVSPWPRLTNSSPLSEWCQETSLSKNVKAWILRANHHEPPRHQPSDDFAHLCTLGRSIIEGDAKWDGELRFTGEFRYTKGYGSGLRTCLADVEIDCAISKYMMLFMLHCLLMTTIPISSKRFAKHGAFLQILCILLPGKCPSRCGTCMNFADDDRCSHVSIDKWVKFWSKKTNKYHPPPPRKEKKTVRPKSTHNPLGDIATHERWSTAEDALFTKLCIERSLKEEVYLAAYLACWLCLFVLPGNDVNSIRPSTFKMASLMANGRRVNLAIPVLASIYEGLNTIATSPKPAELRGPKMTRFSGEGGAKYYEPREARKRIHKAEFVSWACNMLVKVEPFKFIVEPYSPHRFGRQFGYYQDVPGTLKYDTRVASLEEGLRYWRLCVLSKSSSKAWFLVCLLMLRNSARKLIKHGRGQAKGENDPPCALVPPIVIECDSQAAVVEVSKGKCSSHNVADSDSSNKDRHWKRQRKEATPLKAAETNASRSSLANFVAELEDEVQSIDVGEESETSHSSTMTPPLGMGLKRKQSSPPAVSVLKVRAYDEARSLSSEKLSQSLHEQQLKEVKARLQGVQAKASEEALKSNLLWTSWSMLRRYRSIEGQRTNLRATLKEKKQLNHDTQAKVHEVEKDLAALEKYRPSR
ncbi:UNVERIFIED_CONTAM: hypothetical protein Sradi_6123100 [Sesamum radiatum]|uniref:Aminotransferase-like plant mobile domain-containing protein n=1 Tax=Sesamum radiatum TaxID=300843 RepID=A0AAW2KN20_SESRA